MVASICLLALLRLLGFALAFLLFGLEFGVLHFLKRTWASSVLGPDNLLAERREASEASGGRMNAAEGPFF